MEHTLSNIGHNIRKYRILRGMTQKDLGFDADMDPGSICKIETGKINIKVSTLLRIAKVLGVEIQQLMEEEK